MDQNRLINALYAAIFQGVNLPQGSNAPVVSFERPGLPIDPAEYSNPWSSDNQNGNPRALEAFSALVDQVPYPGPVFWPNGCSVEALYGLMVESTAGVVDAVTAKAFNTAKFKYESTSRASMEFPTLTYHPSYPSPFRWCDLDAGWTDTTIDTSAPTAPQPPIGVSTQLAKLDVQARSALWRVSPAVQATAPVMVMRSTSVAGDASRKMASTDRLVAQRTKIMTARAANNAAVAATPSFNFLPAAGVMVSPVLRDKVYRIPPIKVSPPPPVIVEAPPTSSLKLSFKSMRVKIERQWMDVELMSLPGWSLSGISEGFFSNGAPLENPGIFPLLPLSFIAVKDIRLSGTWSPDDRRIAEQVASGSKVSAFGPLLLSNAGAARSTFDGATLTSPGIQILAWILNVVPKTPPKS